MMMMLLTTLVMTMMSISSKSTLVQSQL